jgi:NAD-dependent dihydropyrimidine dehydrogenase PreA subunit
MGVKRNTIKRLNIELIVNPDYCKGCEICAEIACVRGQYEMYRDEFKQLKARPGNKKNIGCVGCGYCELLCPSQAIRVKNGWHDHHIIIPQEE